MSSLSMVLSIVAIIISIGSVIMMYVLDAWTENVEKKERRILEGTR